MEVSSKIITEEPVASFKSKFEQATEDQIERVSDRALYDSLFHEPMPNNFSIVLTNKEINLGQYIDDYSESLKQFNVVNFNLFRFCELKIDEVPWVDETNEQNAREALAKWQRLMNAGNSFLCFQYVSYLIRAFIENNYPVLEVLREPRFSPIIEKLVDIDHWVKSFFKMGLYLDFDTFYEHFDQFLAALDEKSDLFEVVDKLEVAREFFPTDQRKSNGPQVVLSIFFNADRVQKPEDWALSTMTTLLTDVFLIGQAPTKIEQTDFLDLVHPNICLSQGFKAYKKYLNLLGEIGHIYDEASNYAYLKH